jgi:eukaryotic-like serine/threonine-protein kinase
MSPCPSPETLGRLAHSSSSGSGFSAMEAHVEACPACQGVLEQLAAESSESTDHEPERLPSREQPPTIPGFVIERELGRGGMAVVYQAWQPQLARRVAIKVVSASVRIEAEDRRLWLREARAIGRVRHRNIVQLHDAGEQDGCLYLVLDLITGGSLAERLTGPLPGRVAVELMAAVARAVEQIHEAGMLHLDIKPANILLDGLPDGPLNEITPMIADFGIARAGDDPGATATGLIGVRGTPSFMAPEQIAGDRAAIGPRTDVYSLGATLYSLLTGRPPFQAASVIETLDLVRTREPAPPRTLVPGVPRDLETITLTCLRKDPLRRYASAEALADDLQRWLDGFPIRARSVSKFEHANRWCRRRPAFASLLAVLAFTVVSSLVGLLTLWRRSETERARAENALALAIASDEATSRAVRDLVGLLAMSVNAPQSLASERVERASHVVRDLTAKLRQDQGFAASNLVAICDLEYLLADDLERRGDHAAATALITDSLELLAGRRRHADDPDVDEAYARALMLLGWIDREQARYDETLVFYQRAEATLEGLAHDPRKLDVILSIDEARRAIVWLLGRKGVEEPRRRVMESHVRMLEQLSKQRGGERAVGLLAKMARSDLALDQSGGAKFRDPPHRFAAHELVSERFEWKVADWIAEDIQPYPPRASADGEPEGRLDPDAHAHALILAIESKCKALGVYPALLPAAAFHVAAFAIDRGAEQRHTGNLAAARRTVACLFAFAKLMAKKDPNEAVYHLLLSEAFQQESKNAWKVPDYTAIEGALRKALGEASTALRLNPRSPHARMMVSGLQDKLIGLASRRP